MRIDALNQVSQLYQATQTKRVSKSNGLETNDSLEISQTGKDYAVAKAALKSVPDVREDLVADIKARIENGTYNVSDEDIADKILNNYFNTI